MSLERQRSVPRPLGSRLTQANSVVTCETDTVFLTNMATGRRITLDDFGARVWALLGEQPTLPALVVRLRDDGTSAERLAEDVTRLLARWRASSLIAWR